MNRFRRWLRDVWPPSPRPMAGCSLQFPSEPVEVAPADAPLEVPAALLDNPEPNRNPPRYGSAKSIEEEARWLRLRAEGECDGMAVPVAWLAPGTSYQEQGPELTIRDGCGNVVWGPKRRPGVTRWRCDDANYERNLLASTPDGR